VNSERKKRRLWRWIVLAALGRTDFFQKAAFQGGTANRPRKVRGNPEAVVVVPLVGVVQKARLLPRVLGPQEQFKDSLEAILHCQPKAVAMVARELLRMLDKPQDEVVEILYDLQFLRHRSAFSTARSAGGQGASPLDPRKDKV